MLRETRHDRSFLKVTNQICNGNAEWRACHSSLAVVETETAYLGLGMLAIVLDEADQKLIEAARQRRDQVAPPGQGLSGPTTTLEGSTWGICSRRIAGGGDSICRGAN